MRTACFLVVIGMIGCAGSSPPVAQGHGLATAGESPTLDKSPDSGQVDRVGLGDGALGPDGTNDLGFVVQTDGPISAIFLVGVDDGGKPTGAFQADTLVGSEESPQELGAKTGNGTSGLGVLEGDKVLNTKDGALQPLGEGPHRLTLYIAPSPAAAAGTKLRVYVQRPDKSLIGGGTVTN